jgi:hypothetical protein
MQQQDWSAGLVSSGLVKMELSTTPLSQPCDQNAADINKAYDIPSCPGRDTV